MSNVHSEPLGAGFIPRVSYRSRPGVMQALRPSDLLSENELAIPYVIADATLAASDDSFSSAFHDRNIPIIIDTQAWRYSDPRTLGSRWADFRHAPPRPFTPSRQWIHEYVLGDLSAQVDMGCRCLMLPGWFSSLKNAELAANVATWTLEAFDSFRRKGFLAPVISWLPIKLGSRDACMEAAKVYAASGIVQALYTQLDRVSPLHEPIDRLKMLAKLMLEIQRLGSPVIAGHLGPIGTVMRAIGIAAVDCGPCEGHSFDFARSIRDEASRGKASSKPLPVRMWISEIGQTITSRQMTTIRGNRIAFAEIMCRRPCHQYRVGPDTLSIAVQHSLICLSEEARQQSNYSIPIRMELARRSLNEMKSRIALIDPCLKDQKQRTLLQDHLDVQLDLLEEASTFYGVA